MNEKQFQILQCEAEQLELLVKTLTESLFELNLIKTILKQLNKLNNHLKRTYKDKNNN